MKVALKHVRPNPFRDMDAYPINRVKIDQLKKSITSTDFWDNIVARKADDGCIEIAYGHHRLTALRELYDGDHEFTWIVRDLDDQEMIKIMAHENLDEWGHDSAIERETIRAVVLAYGAGKIALRPPKTTAKPHLLRYAPSFCLADQSPKAREIPRLNPYSADTISAFLGGTMVAETVKDTLQALCLMEQGHLTESQMKGLSSTQARTTVREVSRAVKQAEAIRKEAEREAMQAPTPVMAKKVKQEAEKKSNAVVKNTAKKVSQTLQSGGTAQEAKQAATAAKVAADPQAETLPEINDAAKSVASKLMKLLDPEYKPGADVEELIKYKQYLEPSRLNDLDRGLAIVIEYAQGYRARLK